MSRSSSFIADNIAMPSKLRSLVQAPKPAVKICMQSRQKTYTTLDRIKGEVTIVAPVDTPFENVDIEFVGTSRTYVERLTTAAAASGRSEAFHQFLKLSQPGLSHLYPEDRVFRAGVEYKFPFVFAVPQQLLPRVCQHTVNAGALRDAHLRLPPTFGDKDLSSKAGTLDDMAPDMASIRYGVFAKVAAIKTRGEESWCSTIAAKAVRVRVIPAIEEEPPLSVHEEDCEYVTRKEKTIRKNILSGKAGTLVMETDQPGSLKLHSYNNPDSRTTTMATAMLRFDPIDDKATPPKLGSLSSKLKVATFFACTARRSFPTKNSAFLDLAQGMHTEQLGLSARCMANVEWTKHDPSKPETLERRDSAASGFSLNPGTTPEPSSTYKGNCYYTARIVIPISLPQNKAFPPTFHSCLVSRVYTLKLDLSLHSAGIAPSMDLKVPIQVSSEGIVGDEFSRRGSVETTVEAELEGEDVTSFFEARTIRIPSESFTGRSRIGSQAPVDDAPPGYSAVAPASTTTYTRRSSVILAPRSMSVPVY